MPPRQKTTLKIDDGKHIEAITRNGRLGANVATYVDASEATVAGHRDNTGKAQRRAGDQRALLDRQRKTKGDSDARLQER